MSEFAAFGNCGGAVLEIQGSTARSGHWARFAGVLRLNGVFVICQTGRSAQFGSIQI